MPGRPMSGKSMLAFLGVNNNDTVLLTGRVRNFCVLHEGRSPECNTQKFLTRPVNNTGSIMSLGRRPILNNI